MARLAAAERTTVYVIGDGARACPAPEPRRRRPRRPSRLRPAGCPTGPEDRTALKVSRSQGLTRRLVVLDRQDDGDRTAVLCDGDPLVGAGDLVDDLAEVSLYCGERLARHDRSGHVAVK
jgi:hypothetical protein